MTENQLFPMSAELFDTSSNSNNPLKYELYSLGLGNSNSSSAFFGTSVHTLSPQHQLTITTAATSGQHLPAGNNCSNNIGINNVMLTNAITIPRSNNTNQGHNNSLTNHNHNNSSACSSLSPLQQQMMSSQNQQQQLQQQQQQQQRILVDLSEFALEALDAASLSPTLLQDVSLSAASGLQSMTPNGNVATGFYDTNTSPDGHSANNSIAGSVGNDSSTLLGLSASISITDDVHNSLIYEAQNSSNSNKMWSDISNAMKTEPLTLEDDYAFNIDKHEIQNTVFSDLNDEHFLDDIANIEDLLPTTGNATAQTNFLLSPQSNSSLMQLTSPQPSPGGPPLELLQQQHLQQQQSLPQQLQALQQELAQNNSSNSSSGVGGGGVGAIHHAHHNHHSSSSPYDIYHSTPHKQQQQLNNSNTTNAFSPGSQNSNSPLQLSSISPPPPLHRSHYQGLVKSRNMQQLLKKGFSMSPDRNGLLLAQSVPGNAQLLLTSAALSPGSSGFGSGTGSNNGSARKSIAYQPGETPSTTTTISRLSSSAPTHLGFDIWMRREPRQHLLSTGSLAEAESFSSLSTGSVLSPEGNDYSQDDDEDASTDYNSDHYDDYSSDNGSDNDDIERHGGSGPLSSSKGKERFFWQYNVQAKGPKGKRLVFQSKLEDPHVLNEVTDPVFSPNCAVRGIKVYKHSGKARKGDGNDLTPNPRKLQSIGKELDKLNRTINDIPPVSELPFNVRPKSRKEKNKLASRACRLKKKAQHEANKIKLFGLEIEHKRLLNGIEEMKHAMMVKYRNQSMGESNDEVNQQIERIYKTATTGICIAGGTTDFVNKVLDNVKGGVPNGGLDELKH